MNSMTVWLRRPGLVCLVVLYAVAVSLVPVELRTFARSLAEEYELRASPGQVGFEERIDLEMPAWTVTDPLRLRQVVSNLLNNAFKFTQAGCVRFAVRREDDRAVFAVSDTCVGIPAEDLPRVFEPFFQASNHQQHSQGVGLGLHICRRLLDGYFPEESTSAPAG